METRGALLWEPGTNSGWSVEEIQIDPPKEREVLVKLDEKIKELENKAKSGGS